MKTELRLYLDTCCYNHPFNDITQNTIHDEADAITSIINRCSSGFADIVGSAVLEKEIDAIKFLDKKEKVSQIYKVVTIKADFNKDIIKRAEEMRRNSAIRTMDSLHLAVAESADVDVFLTTDYKLIKMVKTLGLSIRVMNPVRFLAEVIENDC